MQPGFRGSTAAQLEADVVLVALVGRTVGHEEEARCAERVLRNRATVLPEVLTDGEGDVDAADAHDDRQLAGHEVAELVEDPVVGQVVLRVAGHDRRPGAGPQRRSAGSVEVSRARRGHPRPGPGSPTPRGDRRRRQPPAVMRRRWAMARDAAMNDGRSARSSTGIAGEEHLREQHEVRAGGGSTYGPVDDQIGVAAQVSDRRVGLRHRESQPGHASSVFTAAGISISESAL